MRSRPGRKASSETPNRDRRGRDATESTTPVAPPEGHGPALRLALVDPRFLVRAAVSYLLENNADGSARSSMRVRTFASALEFVTACDETDAPVDLIIFNVGSATLNDAQVVEDIRLLRTRAPVLPLVVLSDRDECECDCAAALRQGIAGYIPTTVSWPIAVQALRLVHAGGTFMPAQALAHGNKGGLAEIESRPLERDSVRSFTTREREVLHLMREGKSNKIIAHLLRLSESTVKVYVRQIMKKLGATNRTHAIFLLSQASASRVDGG